MKCTLCGYIGEARGYSHVKWAGKRVQIQERNLRAREAQERKLAFALGPDILRQHVDKLTLRA